MTQRANFRQADVTRAIAGAKAAGLAVERVVVEAGRIEIIVGGEGNANRRNPLDRLHAA